MKVHTAGEDVIVERREVKSFFEHAGEDIIVGAKRSEVGAKRSQAGAKPSEVVVGAKGRAVAGAKRSRVSQAKPPF